jgi:hypothetical protein
MFQQLLAPVGAGLGRSFLIGVFLPFLAWQRLFPWLIPAVGGTP